MNFADVQHPRHYAVKPTPELKRVLQLPRRGAAADALELTRLLRTPDGEMTLRKEQAQALWDIGTMGGLFGILRCGAGKTIVSLLAPVVAFSRRPLLLVPAKLVAKTNRDRRLLARHWDLGEVPMRIMSYEWLGRVQAADALERYQPDLIVADECHKLRYPSTAIVRRVHRYFRTYGETKCVAMSGTITKRSLHDFAHILQWIYGPKEYPLPVTYPEREIWADALDERKNQTYAQPGALEVFCTFPHEKKLWRIDERRAARQAFRRHFVSTPGIVATKDTPIDATLIIQSLEAPTGAISTKVDSAFATLRALWETPDGWPMVDGLEMFRHARELALGFYYRWDPRPPEDWLEARKEWCSFARNKIKYSNKWDSELQVRQAFAHAPQLAAWEQVKGSFEPNTVPVWLDDDYLVNVVKRWAKTHTGIVWTEHTCVGERLEKETGLTYYGREGRSREGVLIDDHSAEKSLIASIQSNGEGRNLQAWGHNLVVSPPPNGQQFEQLISRSHRDGQESDEVTFDVLMTCKEHVGAFAQAMRDARYVEDMTGSPQKLLLADVSVLEASDVSTRKGARWQ